jgi:hypothetical protein
MGCVLSRPGAGTAPNSRTETVTLDCAAERELQPALAAAIAACSNSRRPMMKRESDIETALKSSI